MNVNKESKGTVQPIGTGYAPRQVKLSLEEAAYIQPFIETAIALRSQAEARAKMARDLALRLTGHALDAPLSLHQDKDGSIWLVYEETPIEKQDQAEK